MTGEPGGAPGWLAEIEPAPGPPFLSMGVRALAPGRWLTPGDAVTRAAKRTVLAAHRDEVLVVLPGLADPVAELVEAVARDVDGDGDGGHDGDGHDDGGGDGGDDDGGGHDGGGHDDGGGGDGGDDGGGHDDGGHGGHDDGVDGDGGGHDDGVDGGHDDGDGDGRTGPPTGSPTAEALEQGALRVAEDLCLLVRDGGHWVLGAACVCFPSHWRPAGKLGRPVVEIHAPVPHYAGELATRVDRFIDRLTPGRATWRRNWLVHTDDRLFAPDPAPPPDPPLSGADAGDRLWLRSERQTLRRLPTTGAVVFTICTQQAPLAVVAAHPELRARMAAAVASWSDELVAYRGGEAVRAPLLAWLQAGGGS